MRLVAKRHNVPDDILRSYTRTKVMSQGDCMIHLVWMRFENFFDLYAQVAGIPRLIYVIGEAHHCYIGSVGGQFGERGLRVRYERQYIDRAKSIFGMDAPQGQPAFAAVLDDDEVAVEQIEPLEHQVQQIFIDNVGIENADFTPRGQIGDFNLVHDGDMPAFLG